MKSVLVLVAMLGLQEDTGAQFYKFKKDTCLTYKVDVNGKEGKLVQKVLKEEDGKVFVESQEFEDLNAKATKTGEMVWCMDDGHLAWGRQDGDRFKAMWRFYKPGSKKGDTWKTKGDQRGDVTHLGAEDVTVPAGTYKGAVHTQIKLSGDETLDFYLAADVGLVKFVRVDGDRKIVVELKERVEGK